MNTDSVDALITKALDMLLRESDHGKRRVLDNACAVTQARSLLRELEGK